MFKSDTIRVLDLLETIISGQTYFIDEERNFIDSYYDSVHNEQETILKKKIMRIEMRYFAKINFKNFDDPNNKILVSEMLGKIQGIKKELESL